MTETEVVPDRDLVVAAMLAAYEAAGEEVPAEPDEAVVQGTIAVLSVVGRLLGERLDATADDLGAAAAAVFRRREPGVRLAASRVRALCGTPLPTEGGGGGG